MCVGGSGGWEGSEVVASGRAPLSGAARPDSPTLWAHAPLCPALVWPPGPASCSAPQRPFPPPAPRGSRISLSSQDCPELQ